VRGGGGAPVDFGPLAETYDRLRPVDDNWWELFHVLVAEGDLLGCRVLDVGCGTGQLARALAERGARVWGVDPSEEMLAHARRAPLPGGRFMHASAERLPFKDGWFDRAVLRQVVHLVDRGAAFGELARILAPGGRVVVATFHPDHFDRYWVVRLFPEIARIDRNRFPGPEAIVEELRAAGFVETRMRRLEQHGRLSREEALERIRGRFISTLHLLDEATYEAGLARAERELPPEVPFTLDWVVLTAELAAAGRAAESVRTGP
jgi:SAM-dependent methyltransferase